MTAPALLHPTDATHAQLSQLIGHIYQAALAPGRWEKVVEAMGQWIGCDKAILLTPLHPPDVGGLYFNDRFPPSALELWRTRYHGDDLWSQAGVRRSLFISGLIATGDELVPRHELLASRWYREFLYQYNVGELLTGIVLGVDARVPMPVTCSFFRPIDGPGFGEVERSRLALLMPHLAASLGVMQRLRLADLKVASSLAALDALPHGVLLVGPPNEVVFANRAGRRICAENAELRLVATDATRIAAAPAVATAIAAALKATLAPRAAPRHHAAVVHVPRAAGRPPLVLHFSRSAEHDDVSGAAPSPLALVFVKDPAQTAVVDPQLVRQVFGLSPAETRVALAHNEHGVVVDVAAALSLSPNTVKTHLKQIYAKLNIGSRWELARALSSLAPH